MADTPAAIALRALLAGHEIPSDLHEAAAPGTPGVPAALAQAIVDAGRRMDQRGWVPATAGNLSHRLPDGRIAITRSGCHKGLLTAADIMLVDADGEALSDARPSAETLLHCQIYAQDAAAGAVLHGHSVAATALSLHLPGPILLIDYEVLKAFPGQRTHQGRIELPVFDNDQDIARLARTIAPAFATGLPAGYVIRGHGVYAWGPDMPTAMARLEALEFLLACELERGKLR